MIEQTKWRIVALSTVATAVFVLAPLASGCGDDAEPPEEATFTTYNVGLARGFVDYATARTGPVAEAVAGIESDAVCLQEVWLVEDDQGNWTREQIDAVQSAASEAYPHTYLKVTEPKMQSSQPACGVSESEPLRKCVEANCGDVANDQLASCALDNCGMEFNETSSECQSCIASNLGKSIDEILLTCRSGSDSLTSNGHNGLMLLSKHPFEKTEFKRMKSTVAQRAALHAVVDVPEFGKTDLYCTHLAASLSALEYPGEEFGSYQEEQAAQIDTLLNWINMTASTGRVVLMGDMNTGPAVGELEAELKANYQKFVAAEFRNPYLEQDAPKCTFCGSNTLIGDSSAKAIDHVLFEFGSTTSDLRFPTRQRILDEKQSIETSEGTENLHLSDHFGVRTTVERP